MMGLKLRNEQIQEKKEIRKDERTSPPFQLGEQRNYNGGDGQREDGGGGRRGHPEGTGSIMRSYIFILSSLCQAVNLIDKGDTIGGG